MIIRVCAILFLSLLVISAPVRSGPIKPGSVKVTHFPDGSYSIERQLLTARLFSVSPFMGSKATVVPGFSDPLGTGIDPALRVFAGKVHFMDLLGDYGKTASANVQEIQLSPNALSGIDMRSDLLTDILEGNQRAYDRSVFNLNKTTVENRYGLPVTTETSPLSLAGFGSVHEMLMPVETQWNRCKAQKKRLFILEDVPKNMRKYYKPNPRTCFKI